MLEISANALEIKTRPEHELLLCCVKNYIGAERVERQIEALLRKDIDWVYLLQTATWHKTMPLLYWSLNSTYPEAVPKDILTTLRDYFYANATRNLFQSRELLKLLDLLQSNKIRVIPYKGVMLTASIYGDLALRHIGDLDILVHEQDFQKTKALLIEKGYQPQLQLHWEHHFVNIDGTISVDLHRVIAPSYLSFPLDFESLRLRLEPIFFAGTTMYTIQPEDLLLILCVQWGKDCCEGRERLSQLCDVAQLLHVHQSLDWVRLLDRSRTLGCERMLLLELFLVHDLLGIALPQVILNRLQVDTVVKLLAKKVRSQLWRDVETQPRGTEEKSFLSLFLFSYKHRFHMMMRERLLDKVIDYLFWLRMFFKMAFIPNDEDLKLLSLPKILFFLYYPLHILRLTAKHCINLIEKIKKLTLSNQLYSKS
jgi:hypothetical protein